MQEIMITRNHVAKQERGAKEGIGGGRGLAGARREEGIVKWQWSVLIISGASHCLVFGHFCGAGCYGHHGSDRHVFWSWGRFVVVFPVISVSFDTLRCEARVSIGLLCESIG